MKNGESSYGKGSWSVVVETDKVVKRIIPLETGIKGETELVDAEFFKPSEMGMVKDGVLNVGISKHIYDGVGGFPSVWYQVFVIEVDKNVTNVNLEIFY